MLSSVRVCVNNISGTRLLFSATYKRGQMLQKMVKKQKNKQNSENKLLLKPTKVDNSNPYANEGDSRRITALNKIFMQEITSVVGSKIDCVDLLKSGFEITKVKLTSSRSFLNIYWIIRENSMSEEEISNKLNDVAVEIKEHLQTLRYYSRTPSIRFVKDKSLENALSLEDIFFSSEFQKDVQSTLPEKVVSEFDPDAGEEFPNMRQNVMGLDHTKLRTEIKHEKERHKVFTPKGEFETAKVTPDQLVTFDKETFRKFFQKKLRMDRKMDEYAVKKFKSVNEEDEKEPEEDNFSWEYSDEENEKLSAEDSHNEFWEKKK